MKNLLLLPIAALALSACSLVPPKPDYQCPLNDVAGAKCASVEDAYKASRAAHKEDISRVQSVFDARVQQPASDSRPYFQGQASNYPEPGQNGMPVFAQPKVMRVWVAPYVDAEGNLRSGEYTYFSTPGHWNYGTLKNPGAASGIFEPSRASNLGFNPVVANKTGAPSNTTAPPKPGDPSGATPQNSGGALGPASVPGLDGTAVPNPTSATNITQPYQRLGTSSSVSGK